VWGAIGSLGDPDSSRGFVGPDATGVEGLPFLSRLPTGVRVCGQGRDRGGGAHVVRDCEFVIAVRKAMSDWVG
jgi:hypothetical protein